jgi:hypothetical protein
VELFEPVVDFKKRSAIKSQDLADFITDLMQPSCYTKGPVSYPIPIGWDRSLYTCAQDIQITCTVTI